MKIRKCRKYTSFESSQVVELDPDYFRNLSVPFNGETDEDFLNYLNDNISDLEGIKDEIDGDIYQRIMEIYQPEFESGYTEYYNSSIEEEETWLESGEIYDEEEFETFLSTNN